MTSQSSDSFAAEYASRRNDHLAGKYMRISKIPDKGYLENGKESLEKMIVGDTKIAAKDCLAIYKEEPCAKPGTIPHDITLKILDLAQRISNPNGVDREMFRGAANRELDVISMVSGLFGKDNDDDLKAGYLLSGGTESLNQVAYMLRNKYFIEELGINSRTLGLANAVYEASKKRLANAGTLIRPRILLPPNFHFCGIKGIDLLGLGTDSLTYYDLNSNFEIDEASLRKTISNIYEQGDDIIFSFAVAGDTMHGKVHDIRKLSAILEETSLQYKKPKVPVVVDAAGSFLFIGVMHDNPRYDGHLPEVSFKIPNVEAIVGDPHKQPMPYNCGLLMLKDMKLANYTDVRNITCSNYLDMDEENRNTTAALATIPTSRSGSAAFAVWAYLVYQGLSGLQHEKEKIWSLVKDFKDYIVDSAHYELVCEPQTQVVSFRFRGSGSENIDIYRSIKNSKNDFCYISQDTGMTIKTREDMIKAAGNNNYGGLFVTIMEHNRQKDMDLLKERLDEEAYFASKRRLGGMLRW